MTEKTLLAVQKAARRRKYTELISFTMLWTLMRFVPTLQLCARTVERQTYRCAVRTNLTSFEGILWCAVEASCDTRVWSVREAFQSETRPSIGIMKWNEFMSTSSWKLWEKYWTLRLAGTVSLVVWMSVSSKSTTRTSFRDSINLFSSARPNSCAVYNIKLSQKQVAKNNNKNNNS